MLCTMVLMPRKKKVGSVPVYLNVYDLTPINGYAYWFGLGIYHSGVQVHGVEYGFGAHEHSATGIFEVEPRQCPGFTFRKSILIGRTDLGPKDVRSFMEKLATDYSGNTYHLITKNCNHFCNDVCIQLTGKPIPSWVNRLARLDKEEVASGISFHPPFPLRHLTKPVTVQALSNAMVGLPNLQGQPCKSSSLPVGTNNSLAYSYQDCHGRHSFSRFLQLERCLELELVGNFILVRFHCDNVNALGFLCNCVLPAELNETRVRQVRSEGKLQPVEKKLRSQPSKFVPSSKPLPPSLKSCPPGPAMSSRQRRCIPSSSLIHSSSTSTLSLKL
ncbi:hypothetical protein Goshw_003214 [Gossypium schwendimanii]|uniref:PPPDE domain-containing protein n=1 Tax=Gossypium schwendimanii TaxID=34291 RepID=A0A7J9M9N8_GOSSC|nr:hypothetical protein [Gossypium schwendimanii]